MTRTVIDSIAVRGNVRQSAQGIIALSGMVAGNEYSIFDIQRAEKDLWRTQQFNDIRTYVAGVVGGSVTLVF